jgi:protein SCO1/2
MNRLLLVALLLAAGCSRAGALPVLFAVPDFTLTERSNREVKLEDLAGRVWIADFIFTRCAGICPAMSSNMSRLQQTLPAEIRLVSFSVDPSHDTPDVLSDYARRYGADSERWLFLTGDTQSIHRLSIEGFKLAVEEGGTRIEPVTHSSRFVLVDREARVRGYYALEDDGAFERLVRDARRLLQ